jgi:hypothetical protein
LGVPGVGGKRAAGRCVVWLAVGEVQLAHCGHGPPVTVFVFDLLALDGEDLRIRPLRERKALLTKLIGAGDAAVKPVHFIAGASDPMVESVRELGLEGVVAKYAGAPYQGGRTSLWQKLVLRRPEKGWRVEQLATRRARH